MTALTIDNLSLRIGGAAILSGVSFEAPTGAVTGLVGPNGAGKSTLFSAMLGLNPPQAGSIHFEDQDLLFLTPDARAKLLAWVPQSSSTEERLTVRDVVMLGRIPFQSGWGLKAATSEETIVAAALAETGVAGFASRLFNTLSGGEQQRVHLARAIAQEPRLLLLDEPISHLDIQAQLQMFSLMRRRAETGCTVIAALHDLNQALRFCDHLVVLSRGRVVVQGLPRSVLQPDLLADVYGVRARLLDDPRGPPVIVYDAPAGFISQVD